MKHDPSDESTKGPGGIARPSAESRQLEQAVTRRLWQLQSTAGNQALLRLLKFNVLQAKLHVSQPGDGRERQVGLQQEGLRNKSPKTRYGLVILPAAPAVSLALDNDRPTEAD